ncbi:MAG: exo-alpha-sialidase [Rhodopirellula sp.]|nr:exo-alpha-sialidase [Rhodopirellula sp.]
MTISPVFIHQPKRHRWIPKQSPIAHYSNIAACRPIMARLAIVMFAAVAYHGQQHAQGGDAGALRLRSKTMFDEMSPWSGAIYQSASGVEMIRHGAFSPDNGRTWKPTPVSPDFDSGLPYGYRRSPHTPWRDPVNGNILVLLNCMDTPDKDPRAHEPRWQWYWYYLRYRVSTDGGRTWQFDEPIIQKGERFSAAHPIDGVHIGKNCYFLGDAGCRPIRTREGTVLVPVQMPPLDPSGEGFHNPGGGWYWLDSRVLIGRWTDDNHITWDVSQPIEGNGDRTARGLYEPTLAEMPDGKILCVMRGSNGGPRDQSHQWPSYKWLSVSSDGGHTWSEPAPWTYSDGEPFFSPASMSELFAHSNGRTYWIGNLSPANCQANHPRWPLVIGRVDPKTHGLIRESLLVIDTKQPDEEDVNLSHWHVFEDRLAGDIVIPMARAGKDYKSRHPVVYVIGVDP